MKRKIEPPTSVAEYIEQHDKKTQAILKKLRTVIMKAAPDAEERISYQMPAYFMKGVLVYFAAWEKHVGFYPGVEAIVAFEEDLTEYVHAKGSIQFPLDNPVPFALVARIVKFRVSMVKQKGIGKGVKQGKDKSAKNDKDGGVKKSSARGQR